MVDVSRTLTAFRSTGFCMATTLQHRSASPRVALLPAVRRHWILAFIPVLLFVGVAIALGVKRQPRYTAATYLSVGHVYVGNPGAIPTVIDATKSLAAVYSRGIRASSVVADTRRRLAQTRVTGQVSATPIPDSPLIKVTAESSSQPNAVRLANASGAALAAYVNQQVRDNGASGVLAQRYLAAALKYRRLRDRSDRLAKAFEQRPSRARKAARDQAGAATDTALLARETLRANYAAAVEGGTSSVAVDVFSRAAGATSDRVRMLQVLGFVGLIGGLAAGAALVMLRARRVARRSDA
jgi:hypothetical protein